MPDPLVPRARQLWLALAGVPVTPGRVAVAPASGLCPAGWAGVVTVGGTVIATAPTDRAARALAAALASVPADAATDPDRLRAAGAPVAEVLGPATLAYLAEPEFRPAYRPDVGRGGDLRPLLGTPDADESGLAEISSATYTIWEGTRVVAASGYRIWLDTTAHLSVLTAPDRRGRGLARAVASAAAADALAAGLLPQWRARPAASRRVAGALGFRELGAQLSVRLL